MRIELELTDQQALRLLAQLQEYYGGALPETRPVSDPMLALREIGILRGTQVLRTAPEKKPAPLLEGPDCVPLPDDPKPPPPAAEKPARRAEFDPAKITSKQWTALLNAGMSRGKSLEACNAMVAERWGCKTRELPAAAFDEALALLRA